MSFDFLECIDCESNKEIVSMIEKSSRDISRKLDSLHRKLDVVLELNQTDINNTLAIAKQENTLSEITYHGIIVPR